jgi:hypothetical protein
MVFSAGRLLSYFGSAVFLCLAIYSLVRNGFSVTVILYLAAAILFYEYSDFLDFVRNRAKQQRTSAPCLNCRATGKIGGRKCPRCGGKGYVLSPKDRGRPPIT